MMANLCRDFQLQRESSQVSRAFQPSFATILHFSAAGSITIASADYDFLSPPLGHAPNGCASGLRASGMILTGLECEIDSNATSNGFQ